MRGYFGQHCLVQHLTLPQCPQTPFCLPFLFSVLTSKGRQYFPGLWIARCSWKVFLTILSQILNNFEQLSPCCRILPHRNIFQRHIVHNRSSWLPPLTVLDLEGNLPRNLPWCPSHNWDTFPLHRLKSLIADRAQYLAFSHPARSLLSTEYTRGICKLLRSKH